MVFNDCLDTLWIKFFHDNSFRYKRYIAGSQLHTEEKESKGELNRTSKTKSACWILQPRRTQQTSCSSGLTINHMPMCGMGCRL